MEKSYTVIYNNHDVAALPSSVDRLGAGEEMHSGALLDFRLQLVTTQSSDITKKDRGQSYHSKYLEQLSRQKFSYHCAACKDISVDSTFLG